MVIGALIVNVFRPWSFARDMSLRSRWWWCLATAACLLLIPTFKHASGTSCPWDLVEFGGSARTCRTGHSESPTAAPAVLSLRARFGRVQFLQRLVRAARNLTEAARRWLAGVWFFGIAFGIAQLLRGAHYPSHSLWTAWLCWTISALLWHAANPSRVVTVRPAEALG